MIFKHMKNRTKKIIFAWIIILAGALYCLFSCTPLQRLQRMERRHPYLFENHIDTLIINDTVRINTQSIDTTFLRSEKYYDTVLITNDTIYTYLYFKGDTVRINTVLKPIVKNITKTYIHNTNKKKPKYPAKPQTKVDWALLILIAVVFFLTLAFDKK